MGFFAETLLIREMRPGILGSVELVCSEKGGFEIFLGLPFGLARELELTSGDLIRVKSRDIDKLNGIPKWVGKNGRRLYLKDFR